MIAASIPARLRQAPPAIWIYLVGIFAMGFTMDGGIASVLQNLYLLRLGSGPEFIGLFNSSGLFVFALISLPIGSIRRTSSRRLLLIGLSLIWLGMLAIPLAHWAPLSWQSAGLLGGRIIALIGLSFFFVHSAPFLMGITTGEWQNRSLSWQTAVLAIAGFAGGLLGGYLPGWISMASGIALSRPEPYQYPLFLASLILLIAFVAIGRMPEPKPETTMPRGASEKHQDLATTSWTGPIWLFVLMISVVRILQVASPGAMVSFANVYFDDGLGISTDKIGLLTAVGRLASVPVALLTPVLLTHWGGFRVVILISLGSAAASLPMVVSDNWQLAGLGYILASAAAPLRYLSFLVYSLSLVSPERRAFISGAGEMSIGFGFAFMALAGGFLISGYGYQLFFGVSLVLSVLGALLYWIVFRPLQLLKWGNR
jgi:MFS family permease